MRKEYGSGHKSAKEIYDDWAWYAPNKTDCNSDVVQRVTNERYGMVENYKDSVRDMRKRKNAAKRNGNEK